LVLLILSTPTYPWYGLLPLGLLPFAGRRLLPLGLLATGTELLLYLQWWWPGNPHWPLDLAYGGSTAVLAVVALWSGVSALRCWRPLTVAPRRGALRSTQE